VVGDDVFEQEQRCEGVVKGIMPATAGVVGFEDRGEATVFAEKREGMVGQLRPRGAGKEQRIDPRAEAVTGKRAQEALLGALAVGDDDGTGEVLFHLRPQGKQGGRSVEVFIPDPVDLARGPGDRCVAGEVRHEALAMATGGRPGREPHLHRDVRATAGRAGGLEVDGGKTAVPDGHGRKGSMASGGLAMGKAPDGGLPRAARSRKFRRS